MPIQYGRTRKMEDLDPYVQDALDLIEFANGDSSTKWGKIRVEMGHSKPFNMKFIGVGNEQWGADYIERYKVFEKRFTTNTLISKSFPEADRHLTENSSIMVGKSLKTECTDCGRTLLQFPGMVYGKCRKI